MELQKDKKDGGNWQGDWFITTSFQSTLIFDSVMKCHQFSECHSLFEHIITSDMRNDDYSKNIALISFCV